MSLPIPSFAALGPTVNMSTLDQQFAALAAASVISCTASGSNAVILTPMTNYPVPTGYTDAAPVFSWKQAQSSTGSVTINVANLGAVNAYKNNGQTVAGATDLVAGAVYTAAYLGALNSGAGGFVVDVVPSALAVAGPVQGALKNLVVSVTSNTQVQVTCDALTLFDGANYTTALLVSSTASTGASGANGIDTGVVAQATFYSVWVIQNTASQATAVLLSLSTNSPIMPAGYAKKARVGWVTTASGSTNLLKTLQNGRRAQYVVTGVSPNTSMPLIASGTAGTYSATAPVWSSALNLGTFIPSTSGEVFLVLDGNYNGGSAAVVYVAPNANYGGYASTNPPPLMVSTSTLVTMGSLVLETQAIYAVSSAAGGSVSCSGWVDNI